MVTFVLWALAGAALLAAGWSASAWHHGRKLDTLHRHLKAIKQTHAEHSEQMKRQIGQLQADLEAHRAAVPPARRAAPSATPRPAPAATAEERKAAVNAMLAAGGFAPTQVVSAEGFATTEVMP
jgi:hypothetical protein